MLFIQPATSIVGITAAGPAAPAKLPKVTPRPAPYKAPGGGFATPPEGTQSTVQGLGVAPGPVQNPPQPETPASKAPVADDPSQGQLDFEQPQQPVETGAYDVAPQTNPPEAGAFKDPTSTNLQGMQSILSLPEDADGRITDKNGRTWEADEVASMKATLNKAPNAETIQGVQEEAELAANPLGQETAEEEIARGAGPTSQPATESQPDMPRDDAQEADGSDPTAEDADPVTPGFQTPAFANPQMAAQMQQMYDENQRNTQFDEWATNSGFNKEQLSQLRGGLNPQRQTGMQPYNPTGGHEMQPGYGQQLQQPQQNSFWGDVGRGAAGGAAIGGGVGAVGGAGVGAAPGAAIGGLAGGIAGGAKNLWNRGKNMWNQFQNFRNQPQQQQGQNPYAYAMANGHLTAYAGSAMRMIKTTQQIERDILMSFLGTLDDYDAPIFLDYLEQQMSLPAETVTAKVQAPKMVEAEVFTPVITAGMASAQTLIKSY